MKLIRDYESEYWTLISHIKKRLGVSEIWIYRRMLRIPGVENVGNDVLEQMDTKSRLIINIRM